MQATILRAAVGAAFAAVTAVASAEPGMIDQFREALANGVTTHVVDIDNDSLLLKRDDGFYTSGMRYTQRHAVAGTQGQTVFGWRIGQELYTASDIKLPPELVGPPDHPYAGWLYAGAFKEVHRMDGSSWRLGLDLGCLGPCAGGERTQTTLHRIIRQPLPEGWGKQVRNELGAVLYGEVAPVRWTPQPWLDVTPYASGRFGNIFTDAGGGVRLRAGRLAALPEQDTLHGFLRADARAVGYNATLQGGYFSNDNRHTVAPKRAVGEVEAGLAWRSGPFAVQASIVRRSNEIRDLPNGVGAQNFARLSFAYTPR